VAVGWSHQTWAVAWNESSSPSVLGTLIVQRFDASGAPIGSPQTLGTGAISDNGVPMIPTADGWAIVTTGSPARLYELDAKGKVRELDLPFGAGRASIASNGTVYAVVGDSLPVNMPAAFVLVDVGGGVVPGSAATVGGNRASLPNVIWTGNEFVVSWSETYSASPEPLLLAPVTPASVIGLGAIYGGPYTAQTNAGFHQLAAGSCGWAVVYGTFTANAFDYLDVRP
jgi:hypothetical protein